VSFIYGALNGELSMTSRVVIQNQHPTFFIIIASIIVLVEYREYPVLIRRMNSAGRNRLDKTGYEDANEYVVSKAVGAV